MIDRNQYLQRMADLVGQMIEDRYAENDIRDIFDLALDHGTRPRDRPYTTATCGRCGAAHIAWSPYELALLFSAPCPNCGHPWLGP